MKQLGGGQNFTTRTARDCHEQHNHTCWEVLILEEKRRRRQILSIAAEDFEPEEVPLWAGRAEEPENYSAAQIRLARIRFAQIHLVLERFPGDSGSARLFAGSGRWPNLSMDSRQTRRGDNWWPCRRP